MATKTKKQKADKNGAVKPADASFVPTSRVGTGPIIQMQLEHRSEQWSGPLPPPAAMEHFNTIIPDGAERIMKMVEEEQAHRIAHENNRQKGEIEATRRGHYLGGAITAVSILLAVGGGYLGVHPAICVAVVGLPIATVLKSIFGKPDE